MKVKVKEVKICNLYKNLNDGLGGKSFVGMKVTVKLEDGKTIRFRTDYIMSRPRRVVADVVRHVFNRSGLPEGVSELVTVV